MILLLVQTAVLVVGVATLLSGAGYAVPVVTIAGLAAGALFVVIGNYMGKLRQNFFAGIRTPWTLSSTAVWERTHRIGGWLFVLAGSAMIIATLIGAPGWLLPVAPIVAGLLACVYSLLIYRRIEHKPSDPQ